MEIGRFEGCLVGLAVGDALGMPVEGMSPQEIAARFGRITDMAAGWLPAGSTTDDTAQALILAESLAERGHFDPEDVMARLVTWYRRGPVGIGGHTRRVLSLVASGRPWREVVEEVERQEAPYTVGNGSLMRCAPIALRYCRDITMLLEASHESSRLTHPRPLARYSCAFFNVLLSRLLRGYGKLEALSYAMEAMAHAPYELLERMEEVPYKEAHQVGTSGFVLDTLECAVWAWWHHDDFSQALITVVNMGGDADTNGAVTGALMGAYLGLQAIPRSWRERVAEVPRCIELARRLFRLAQEG
jgi:ADP-ribosyl-[dinitrogen reductase] hydrolase